MTVELLTEHHLEFLSLKWGCTGSSESTLVKIPHCWKSHVMAHDFWLTSLRDFIKWTNVYGPFFIQFWTLLLCFETCMVYKQWMSIEYDINEFLMNGHHFLLQTYDGCVDSWNVSCDLCSKTCINGKRQVKCSCRQTFVWEVLRVWATLRTQDS